MARGQAQKADTQLGLTNKVAGQYGQQASQLYGELAPQYLAEVNNPGYDPATKAAMTQQGMGAIASSYDTAAQEAGRRTARTRNQAGYGALQDALARNKGIAAGTEAGNLQKQFADEKLRQRQEGLAGLGNLYGLGTDVMSRLYGLGPSTLQARAAGGPSPWWGIAQSLIGAGGQAGSAALGK